MSVKTHEPICIDSAKDKFFWMDHFLGDQVQDEWRDAGTGSAAVVDLQTGGIVRITTGAVSGNTHQLDWNNIRSLHVDKKVSMEARVKLGQTTFTKIEIALRFDGNNYILFYLDVAGIYRIYCINGGVPTFGVITYTPDTSYHVYRIECFPTDEVHFYIDGVETANSPITTNIPDDAGDYLQPYFHILTNENATKFMDVDYCVVRQNR